MSNQIHACCPITQLWKNGLASEVAEPGSSLNQVKFVIDEFVWFQLVWFLHRFKLEALNSVRLGFHAFEGEGDDQTLTNEQRANICVATQDYGIYPSGSGLYEVVGSDSVPGLPVTLNGPNTVASQVSLSSTVFFGKTTFLFGVPVLGQIGDDIITVNKVRACFQGVLKG